MTATINRKLRRRASASVYSAGKYRDIVIELNPDANGEGRPGSGFLGLRLHGTRRTYYLPIAWCYREAVKAELARVRAERIRLRAEKKNR